MIHDRVSKPVLGADSVAGAVVVLLFGDEFCEVDVEPLLPEVPVLEVPVLDPC